MDKDIYTEKQKALLRLWQKNELKRITLLEGSVRSGKTWISLVLWAFWVATAPKDGRYLMAAKTLTSLRRNCLDVLEELIGTANFTYSLPKKEGCLFGRKIYLEGANDARAENKIRGMTLSGAYCDELTLFAEDFFAMLLTRLSAPGAKLIATTNPDSPFHWLKEKYIDRAADGKIDMLTMKFLIDENTFLDADYIENQKKEHVGVFYDRFILGLWVVAAGLVYPNFDPEKHVIRFDMPEPKEDKGNYYISVDYGTLNPCSMGLWRTEDGRAVRVKEFYYDGRKSRKQLTDEEYYSELEKLAGDRVIQYVVVDPSAASFITCIAKHGRFGVKKAANDVLAGIRTTASLLNSGRLLFDESCEGVIKEFRGYSWDEKSGEDKVIKENDHAMDDMRYFCYTVLRHEWHWLNWAVDG